MVLIIERYPRPIAGTPDQRGSEGERERGAKGMEEKEAKKGGQKTEEMNGALA